MSEMFYIMPNSSFGLQEIVTVWKIYKYDKYTI